MKFKVAYSKLLPTLLIYAIGLILLTILKDEIGMFIGCLFMMMGYLIASITTVKAALGRIKEFLMKKEGTKNLSFTQRLQIETLFNK